jgi:ABC-type ATPase with predicted acetyltransferase domain
MSEKRKDEIPTSTRSAGTTSVIDTARDNTLRIIDEFAKAQPQYTQAMTNLQTDFIQTCRNFVQTGFDTERQVIQNLNLPQNPHVSEVVARQSNEITSNIVRAIGTYNQLAVNAIDAARENTKIFNRTVDAVTDFNANIVKAWTNYWASQQQQFTRAF